MTAETMLTALFLVAPALAGSSTSADEIAFRPAPGLVLTKVFTTDQYVSLKEISIQLGDQIQSPPEQVLELSTLQQLAVTDEYRAVGDGRPLSLRRLFERVHLGGSAQFPGPTGRLVNKRIDHKSLLQDQSVVFTWVEDEGDYGRYFDALDPGEELLAELDEDLDARVLLPGKPVSKGDSWDIAPAELRHILAPSGALTFEIRQDDDPVVPRLLTSGVGGSLEELFPDRVDGKVHATYGGRRAVDGVEVGVIAFDFEIRMNADQKERAQRRLTAFELSSGVSVDAFSTKSGFEGRGELLWNLAGGHAHALSVEANGYLDREEVFVRPTATQKDRMVRTMRLAVQLNIAGTFTPDSAK